MESSEDCNICCCNGSSRKSCEYHLALPPIFLDNVYNKYRQPCLAILCILILILFGSQNIYGITMLTCDESNIIDPTCYQSALFVYNNQNVTSTILQQQNDVNYRLTRLLYSDDEDYSPTDYYLKLNKYQITTVIDKVFTIITCIGNSPYHSPFWLFIGFVGTSYSTYSYTESLEFCGDQCKTSQNEIFELPQDCRQFIDDNNGDIPYQPPYLCNINEDQYDLCTQCQCFINGYNSCQWYLNDDGLSLTDMRRMISFIFFIVCYLRQLLSISLILKIIYRFGCRKIEDYTIFHCLDCVKCCKVFSKKRTAFSINLSFNDKNEEKEAEFESIYCSKQKYTNIEIDDDIVDEDEKFDKEKTMYGYQDDKKLCNLFKEFIHPISIRLSTASVICIIFLMVTFYSWYITIYNLLKSSIFNDYAVAYCIIAILLFIDGASCCFIHLRCIYIMHYQFRGDVIKIYTYYNDNDNNDDSHNDDDNQQYRQSDDQSMDLVRYYYLQNYDINDNQETKSCCYNPFLPLFQMLFPSHIGCGQNIVDHIKQCRIMNAYKLIFIYPLCITLGSNLLFISILIPICIIIIIIYLIIIGSWQELLTFSWYLFSIIMQMVWPIIGLTLFDYCILRGNTNQILSNYRNRIKCFWFITLIDSLSTFFSALFMSIYSVIFIRIGYSILILCIGLLTPFRSTLPYPFEIHDSVYHCYCSNVALTALSFLKSNEKKSFSDIAKQYKLEMLIQRQRSFERNVEMRKLSDNK